MTPPGARGLAAVVALAGLALTARTGAAQSATNRANRYLVGSDVSDARALWVNPGALAARRDASVVFDLTIQEPGAKGRLGQVSTGFDARGLAFGYQRDNFTDGSHAHTYRLGLGGAAGRLGAGVALALHRGAARGTGWDIGTRYDWRPEITLGAVVRDLGRPTVGGVRREVTFVPSLTVRPMGSLLTLSTQAAVASSATRGYGFQVGAELPHPLLGIIARLETDRSLRRTALVFGLSIGRADRLGTIVSTTGDLSDLDAASVYGVSSRSAAR